MPEPADDDLRTILRDFRSSVAKEFASIDGRFKQVDERFKQVDDRFKQVDDRFSRLEGRMTDLATEVRTRTLTMETAILNSIWELRDEVLRLHGDHERRLRRLGDS